MRLLPALLLLTLCACSPAMHEHLGDPELPYPPSRDPQVGDILHLPTGYYVTPEVLFDQARRARVVFVGDGIPTPLTATPGDAARGREIVTNRQQGLCLLCHSGSFPEEASPGNLATNLDGSGARWSEAQLRARIVDARRLDPSSLMPAFHATEGRSRVAAPWQNRPILDAQQVEDVVAFLKTLR